jgi:DivIVA domain-containing protein
MPLTPADVHNVAFSKPPLGKRGYNEDEVDGFLEAVEQELNRLYGIIAQLQAGGGGSGATADAEVLRLQGVIHDLRTRLNASEWRVAQLEGTARD